MPILTIGLHSGHDDPKDKTLQESLRLAAIYRHFHGKAKLYLQHSDTEPTVVAVSDTLFESLSGVADLFQQDCIAVYHTTIRKGAIRGPRPGSMAFMREFFVLPSGQRLSEVPYL